MYAMKLMISNITSKRGLIRMYKVICFVLSVLYFIFYSNVSHAVFLLMIPVVNRNLRNAIFQLKYRSSRL